MAGKFQEFIGARASRVAKAFGDGVAAARPRWTYPKGPKSRADLPVAPSPAFKPAKARLRFEPKALFFGESDRPRKLYAAGLEAGAAPDPAKILARESFVAPTVSPRHAEIERSLREEARSLGSAEAEGSASITGDLGKALLARLTASSVEGLSRVALWGTGVGALVLAAGWSWRLSTGAIADPFSYGAIAFAAGFVVAFATLAAARAAGADATGRFEKTQADFSSVVERATGEFRAKLTAQRAGMSPKTGEIGEAIRSASQARMTTIAAMRFFEGSPALSGEGEGHQCGVLAASLQSAAKSSLASGLTAASFFAAVIALGTLAAALYWRTAGDGLSQLMAAEAAQPGVVLLPLAIAAILSVPLIAGPFFAAMGAAGNPAAALKTEPARALADGLRNAALSAAAETEQETIARYAEALGALESKAGARLAAASNDDSLGWRAPQAPRFVGVGFQSVPQTFTTDAHKGLGLKKLFGASRPKRG